MKKGKYINLNELKRKFSGVDYIGNDRYFIELDVISNLVEEYEEKYYPIEMPTLAEIIKDEMDERGITQKQLAEMLGVSPSRISEYMTGKAEPTLKVARLLHKKLDIDPDFILG